MNNNAEGYVFDLEKSILRMYKLIETIKVYDRTTYLFNDIS